MAGSSLPPEAFAAAKALGARLAREVATDRLARAVAVLMAAPAAESPRVA